jgi:hypothetical protein
LLIVSIVFTVQKHLAHLTECVEAELLKIIYFKNIFVSDAYANCESCIFCTGALDPSSRVCRQFELFHNRDSLGKLPPCICGSPNLVALVNSV